MPRALELLIIIVLPPHTVFLSRVILPIPPVRRFTLTTLPSASPVEFCACTEGVKKHTESITAAKNLTTLIITDVLQKSKHKGHNPKVSTSSETHAANHST